MRLRTLVFPACCLALAAALPTTTPAGARPFAQAAGGCTPVTVTSFYPVIVNDVWSWDGRSGVRWGRTPTPWLRKLQSLRSRGPAPPHVIDRSGGGHRGVPTYRINANYRDADPASVWDWFACQLASTY